MSNQVSAYRITLGRCENPVSEQMVVLVPVLNYKLGNLHHRQK